MFHDLLHVRGFRCLRQYLSGRTLILHRTRKCHLLFGGTDQGDALKFHVNVLLKNVPRAWQKWVFPKMVGFPPKSSNSNRVFHYKSSILGETPLFLETPKCLKMLLPESQKVILSLLLVFLFWNLTENWELKDACPLTLPGLISR